MALKTTLEDTKDRLDALLTYANTATGESDTNIGDAVERLVDMVNDHTIEDALMSNGQIDDYVNDRVTEITAYGMYGCKINKLTMKNLETIRARGFMDSSLLTEADFPKLTLVQNEAFRSCQSLKSVDLGVLSSTPNLALLTFAYDTLLEVVIIRKTSVIAPTVNTFQGSSFAPDGTGGYVYVPQALLSQYQSNSDWQQYANVVFRPIEGSIYELTE